VLKILLNGIKHVKGKFRAFTIALINSLLMLDIRYLTSCNISFVVKKKKIKIPHPVGIVIGKDTEIGQGTVIMQNVTIGVKKLGDVKSPKIGENVFIGAGAVVVGDIEIADNAVIKANSTIFKSI
jgi:serine acetyltransferase